jgi:uncharacterized membrane protein
MKKIIQILPLFLIFLSFIVAIFVSPKMPDLMATHWDINGQVNGYMSKIWGLYFMPVLSLILLLLFRFLPLTDPYKKNFKQFENYYHLFIVIVTVFLVYIYLLTIIWNLNYRFNLVQFMSPGFTLLLFYSGILMEKTHQNWFVGIRTPWTMSNPIVWQKTHIIGSKLFKLSAIIALLAIILPQYAIYFILAPILITSLSVIIYSYYIYRTIR